MSKLSVTKSRKSSKLARESKKADEEFALPVDDKEEENDALQHLSEEKPPNDGNDEVDNLLDSADAGQYDLPLDDGDLDKDQE